MNTERLLWNGVSMFCRITTAIVLFSSLEIFFTEGIVMVSVAMMWQILLVSFLTTIGYFPVLIGEQKEKGFTWLPILLYFLYVNVVVLLCGFFFGWFQFESIKMIAIAEFTIGIIFFTVAAITYLADCRTADRINRRLRERTGEENSEME